MFADLRKRLRTLDRRSAWLLLAACTLAPTWHLFFRVQLLEAAIGGALLAHRAGDERRISRY